jgi:hypothetical protein
MRIFNIWQFNVARPLKRVGDVSLIGYVFGVAALILFSIIYGAALAFLAPHLLPLFSIPLVILAALILWALPTNSKGPRSTVVVLTYAFVVALILWPNYLAIALPGLPWLTVIRLVGFPLMSALLLCLSTSANFRKEINSLLRINRVILVLICTFVCIQLLSIAMSHNKAASLQKFIVAQMEWTSIFFSSVYFFSGRGRIERWAGLLWALAIAVGLIGIWQFKLHKLPWVGHIPSFLAISDDSVRRTLAGGGRAYTNGYRIDSTFGTPLGLSEYIALTFPFVLYFGLHGQAVWLRLLAVSSIPFLIFVVVLTDSRLGMVGCFLALLIYPLVEGLRLWRRNRSSIVGPAIVSAYPVLFVAAIAATFTVGKIRRYIWGGGAQQASTNSRVAQYHLGLPKVLHNPLGYGIGQGADTLAFAPFGVETIDTYYLMVALEYGVIGFVVYYSLIAYAIFKSARYGLNSYSNDAEQAYLTPIAISLFSFLVVKSVFSQQDNHPLIFMMLGAIVAITGRSTVGRAWSKQGGVELAP